MRSSSPFEAGIRQFGVWRGAVLLVSAVAAAAMTAWLLSADAAPYGVRVVAGLCAGITIGLALSAAAPGPARLAWDGQRWWMNPIDAAKREPVQGELRLLIDLGIWILLRFVPAAGDRSARVTGLQVAWHALRCAVYSPRLAPGASPGSTVAADPHPPE